MGFTFFNELVASLGALIVVIGSIITLYFKYKKNKRELVNLKGENNVLKKKYYSSSMSIDLADLNEVQSIVRDTFKTTGADRFLLLSAVNGKENFNFVSALYEQHSIKDKSSLSIGACSKYVDIKTDESYRIMLKKIELIKPFISSVASMRDSLLKRIYLQEGVRHTAVFFISRKSLDSNNDRLVYVSWGSHSDEPLNSIQLQGATNKIKKLLNK